MDEKLKSLLELFDNVSQRASDAKSFRSKYALTETTIKVLGKIQSHEKSIEDSEPATDAPFVKVLKDIIWGKYYYIDEIDRLLDQSEEEAKRLGVFYANQRLFLDAAHSFNDILRNSV